MYVLIDNFSKRTFYCPMEDYQLAPELYTPPPKRNDIPGKKSSCLEQLHDTGIVHTYKLHCLRLVRVPYREIFSVARISGRYLE